jgi:hypothetical protein
VDFDDGVGGAFEVFVFVDVKALARQQDQVRDAVVAVGPAADRREVYAVKHFGAPRSSPVLAQVGLELMLEILVMDVGRGGHV